MSTIILLVLTGLGVGALYFLIASGLSLIFGLAEVLNFAHGLFLGVGAYATWWAVSGVTGGGTWGFLLAALIGVAASVVVAVLTELLLIRPLYGHPVQQLLVTIGLSLAGIALLRGVWGTDPLTLDKPPVASGTTEVLGASVPNDRFVLIGAAVLVLVALLAFLRYSRYGLIVRAGVEDRAMVTALGIDVRRAFTMVFAIGGAAAGLAGALAGVYFGNVAPDTGGALLIFAFIVVVIGGMRSVTGCAVAAVAVGLMQQFVNYYAAPGVGEAAVVLLLAAVLIVRPGGLVSALKARTA